MKLKVQAEALSHPEEMSSTVSATTNHFMKGKRKKKSHTHFNGQGSLVSQNTMETERGNYTEQKHCASSPHKQGTAKVELFCFKCKEEKGKRCQGGSLWLKINH